ncbi:N2,N2-dimethylguanosine tRNA methyltransferase-domain-containing protein [Lipomyces oligophaga]|uniref:N2,N2-dimethylguanosine tRNA methyltransferase-domain-containing protein n=1 Tax=Lipomyces oligophaga TaxID=45792 RepID=UPI0034D01CAF
MGALEDVIRGLEEVSDADGKKYLLLSEGKASVLFENQNQVFYNPVQQFNRDLSTFVIRAWAQDYKERKKPRSREERKKREKSKKQAGQVEENSKFVSINPENTKFQTESENTFKESVPDKNESSEAVVHTSSSNITTSTDTIRDGGSSIAVAGHIPDRFVTILEGLSATGLRAIRYALEIPEVKTVVANDFSPSAVEAIKRNIDYNKGASGIVEPSIGDVNSVMHAAKLKPFHCIDLDPYGTAAPFLDAAVQAVANDGLLLITCTDLGVLAGHGYPEKCFSMYGGVPLLTEACHEAAVRIVLSTIATSAARHNRTIEPLLCLSIDFYVRLFVRVKTSPIQVKNLASNTMISYACSGCHAITNQRMGRVKQKNNNRTFQFPQGPPTNSHCDHCGSTMNLAGPMWGGPIHNKDFISRVQTLVQQSGDSTVYKTRKRLDAMLKLAVDEVHDAPFYFMPQKLSAAFQSLSPSYNAISSALMNAGYQVSATHAQPGCIKTNATYDIIFDVMRAWIKENPINNQVLKPHSPAVKLLERREPKFAVDFTNDPAASNPSRKNKMTRYPELPKGWGPLAKAKGDAIYHNNKIQGIKKSDKVSVRSTDHIKDLDEDSKLSAFEANPQWTQQALSDNQEHNSKRAKID